MPVSNSAFPVKYAQSDITTIRPVLATISNVTKVPMAELEKMATKIAEEVIDDYGDSPDFKAMISNAYNTAASLLFSKFKVVEMLKDEDLLWDDTIFITLWDMVLQENTPALIPMKNSFTQGGFLPEYIIYPSLKWMTMVEQGRVRADSAPDTAWCDPYGVMAFSSKFGEEVLQLEKARGTTVPNKAKYVSAGGKIPDHWVAIEFIMIHEILHFVRNDHFFSAHMPILAEIEPDYDLRRYALNVMGDMINNHDILGAGFPQLMNGMFSESINWSNETNYAEMFKRVAAQLKQQGKAAHDNNHQSMDDHTDQDANNQADNQDKNGNQQGQKGQSGQKQGQQGQKNQDGNQQGQDGKEGQEGDQQGQSGGQGNPYKSDKMKAGSKPNASGSRNPKDGEKKTAESMGQEPPSKEQKGGQQGQQDGNQQGQQDGNQQGQPGQSGQQQGQDGQQQGQDGNQQGQPGQSGQQQGGNPQGGDSQNQQGQQGQQGGKQGNQPLTPEQIKAKKEALDKAVDAMNKAAREQARTISDKVNESATKSSKGVDMDALRNKAEQDRAKIMADIKNRAKPEESEIEFGGATRAPAKSWEKITKDMIQKKEIKDESYTTMDPSSAARVSASMRRGGSSSISPGMVTEFDDSKNKVLFVFDNSGSVSAHIKDANASLWKLVKRGQLDESLLLRFSENFSTYEFYPKDRTAALLTNQQEAEIATSKKMPKKFKTQGAKTQLVSVLSKAEGSDTKFTDPITNICIAALKSGWGVLIFTDSDLINRTGNIANVKKVVAEAKKHQKKFGIVMNSHQDYLALIDAVGYSPLFTHF